MKTPSILRLLPKPAVRVPHPRRSLIATGWGIVCGSKRPLSLAAALTLLATASAQYTPTPLDPTRTIPLSPNTHTPLPEHYIWTADDITVQRPDHAKFPWPRADLRVAPHYFRTHFNVTTLPESATLYIAGPRQATIYLNGQSLGTFSTNPDQPINFRVFHADALKALKPGDNVLALEAIRGRGVVSGSGAISTQQLAYGEVLAAKLIPAPFSTEAPPLLISTPSWRSVATLSPNWSAPTFDDHIWPLAATLGPIESDVNLLQWSADAGMYGWPGYMGMSPTLRTFSLLPADITHIYPGQATLTHIESLTHPNPATPFTITTPNHTPTDLEAPYFLVDFGREINGRILIESASPKDTTVSIAYGESELEALASGLTPTQRGGNYLGTNLVEVPANGTARGPKSAFRYVRIAVLRGAPTTAFKSIRLEGIAYPVTYGSFESSDPLLNRIWETGAYTAHLCMQDGIVDAPKRDRGRWAGDLDIEGRVISTAFGDSALLEQTLNQLAQTTGPNQPVNGIPSYTALWITTLATLYQHSANTAFVVSQHEALLRLLAHMDSDLDPATGLLSSKAKGWQFVDWSLGLYSPAPDASIGTTLQYLRAYTAAPALLRAAGDEPNALKYEAAAKRLHAAAQAYLSPETHTAGRTWQLNALATLTDLTNDSAIWNQVLSHVKQDIPTDQVISPYFNAYLIDAMAHSGHTTEALNWIRTYWSGMLAEGATSFWESYDLRWPKTNYHLSLEADGTSGYFVSLAHGWSSGPTAWLTENILGVTPTSPGYATIDIHPNLANLTYAKGTIPTPHGPITISIDNKAIKLDLPPGVESATLPNHPPLTHHGHYEISF